MLKDIVFLLIIILLGYVSFRVFFRPILIYLKKMRIENFQSQNIFDAAPRTFDSQEYQFADQYAKGFSPRPADILFSRVHMLAPNVAQYGKNSPIFIKSSGGIPDTALPIIDLRDPWSTAEISAAEIPESEVCQRSATGLFMTCGVKTLDSACSF